jgi:glycine cleavage system H protein
MSEYPENLYYSRDHEWIRIEGDTGTLGITQFAAQELGEIVYVELPTEGQSFEKGEPFGSVESVKAVSEIFMPVSGTIEKVNDTLETSPELVNDDPHGEGWMVTIKITRSSEIGDLLSSSEYEDYLNQGD